jgi:hypothetical protein
LSALDKHDDAEEGILTVVALRINNAITTRLVIVATLLSSTNTKKVMAVWYYFMLPKNYAQIDVGSLSSLPYGVSQHTT